MEIRLAGWKRELSRAHGLIAGLFSRSEVRERNLAYVQGLLSGCERKNGWQFRVDGRTGAVQIWSSFFLARQIAGSIGS
jgi:hypothetical protein